MNSTLRSNISSTCSAFGVGYMGYMFMPSQLSDLANRFQLTEADLGFIGTLQLTAVALSLFFLSFVKNKLPVFPTLITGCVLVIAAYVLTSVATDFALVKVSMALAGLGMGCAIFAGNSGIAAAKSPERVFALGLAFHQFIAALMIILLVPTLSARLQGFNAHMILAVWSSVMLLLILLSGKINNLSVVSVTVMRVPVLYALPAMPLFFLGFGDASVWPFTGEIGERVGMLPQDIANVQGAALIAGITGTLLAGALANFSRRMVLFAGASVLGAGFYYFVLNGETAAVYAGAQVGALFCYGFFIPFYFAICAHRDQSGRLMSIASGLQMIGLAIAPWLSGIFYAAQGPFFLGMVVLLCLLLALGIALFVQFGGEENTI